MGSLESYHRDETKGEGYTHLNEQADDLVRVSSAQSTEFRRARSDCICGTRLFHQIIQDRSGSFGRPTCRRPSTARPSFTTSHRTCARIPVLHLPIPMNCSAQLLMLNSVSDVRRKSVPALVVTFRRELSCRANSRQRRCHQKKG